jgi:hypothetical protein
VSEVDPEQRSRPGNQAGGENGPAADRADEHRADEPSPLEPLLANLAEIQEYLSLYLAAKADQWKVSLRRLVVAAAVGIGGGALLLTIPIVAAALLLNGCAEAIGVIAGGRSWVGQLVVGGGVILATCGIDAAVVLLWFRSARRTTKRKYEHQHQVQQAKLRRRAPKPAAR